MEVVDTKGVIFGKMVFVKLLTKNMKNIAKDEKNENINTNRFYS